jgi:hypothetical protein
MTAVRKTQQDGFSLSLSLSLSLSQGLMFDYCVIVRAGVILVIGVVRKLLKIGPRIKFKARPYALSSFPLKRAMRQTQYPQLFMLLHLFV